jgi:hypothetical protein
MLGTLDYGRLLDEWADEHELVVIAVGTVGGKPRVAWGAFLLEGRSLEIANDESDPVRVAQALGVLSVLRSMAQRRGFTPA